MAEETVTIIDNTTGKRVDLPILRGTHGPAVFDVRKMYACLLYTSDAADEYQRV